MRKSLSPSPRCSEVMKPRRGSQAERSQSQVNDPVVFLIKYHNALPMKPKSHSTCTDVADILKVEVAHQQRNGNDDTRKKEFD